MTSLIEDASLHNKIGIFEDRTDAGRQLVAKLLPLVDKTTIVLAVPSGGVPIGLEIASGLNCDFDLLIVRKAQIPWNTEAGFGAVNLDGDVVINEALVQALGITKEDINTQLRKTRNILEKREQLFRRGRPFPVIQNRTVILADDGLASGYTMLVAIKYLRTRHAGKIVIAVPTGMSDTVNSLYQEADDVVCLNVRDNYPFAVASAYRNWYDLTDAEVLHLLNRINYFAPAQSQILP